jgi:hypothetical protein
MPAQPARRSCLVIAIATIGALSLAIPALAAAPTISVKGPSQGVKLHATYTVKVSGTATKKANSFGWFEGGVPGGARIKCKPTEQQELGRYPGALHGPYKVQGKFTEPIGFTAASTGKKALCAYLYSPSPGSFSGPTYAHAYATWKVIP